MELTLDSQAAQVYDRRFISGHQWAIINSMFDVLTIGTGTRDIFLESKLFKVVHDPVHLKKLGFISGEAQCFALGGKIEIKAPTMTVGGGAANAAVTFARQGFRTAALMKLGRDENGVAVINALKKERVAALPLFDKKAATAYSVILLSPTGERTILNYRGASEDMRLSEISWKSLRARSVYIVPGRIPFVVMRRVVAHFKRQGALVAMNPSKYYLEMGARKLSPILKALDVVIMNREEAAYLTGKDYAKENMIFKALDRMVSGIAVMTDGSAGVKVSDGKKVYGAGIFKEKKLIDRTGAGDAFGSGFVSGLLRSHDHFSSQAIREAIRLASANATAKVEHIGAQSGLLLRAQFSGEKRWKNFPILEKNL